MTSQGNLFEAGDSGIGETLSDLNEEITQRVKGHPVFAARSLILGAGPKNARVAFVGESPGQPDIASGTPFIGPVGDMLNVMISSIGLRRDQCYLTNTVKFVSSGSEITKDILAFFLPLLQRELVAAGPDLIVSLGNTPTQALLETRRTITDIHGELHAWRGIKLVPTFNPAYLLRDPARKREAWEDLKRIRAEL